MGFPYQLPITAPPENTAVVALGSEGPLEQLPTELPLPAVQAPQLVSEIGGEAPDPSSTHAPTGPETETV